MSKGQQYLDRRTEQDQNANKESEPEVEANKASSYYGGVRNAFNAGRAAVEAHPSDEPQWTSDNVDTKSPQVQWIAALNEKRNAIGAVQSNENPFNMEEYSDEFDNELPCIESEEIDGGVIDMLESAGYGNADELRKLQVPVVNGEPLPVMVNNEDALNDALALLAEVPDEPEAAGQPEPETNALEKAADEGTVIMADIEAAVEKWANPTDEGVTIGTIRGWCSRDAEPRLTDLTEAQALLAVEKHGDARKTAIEALEGRINAIKSDAKSETISGAGEGTYLAASDGGSEQDNDTTEDTDEGGEAVTKESGVTVEVSVDIPEDASRGTRLKEAGNLMEMGYDEDEAMEMVGL